MLIFYRPLFVVSDRPYIVCQTPRPWSLPSRLTSTLSRTSKTKDLVTCSPRLSMASKEVTCRKCISTSEERCGEKPSRSICVAESTLAKSDSSQPLHHFDQVTCDAHGSDFSSSSSSLDDQRVCTIPLGVEADQVVTSL